MRYFVAVLFGGILVVGIAVWWMTNSVGTSTGTNATTSRFTIGQGQKLRSVAVELEKQKFIPSAGAWTLYVLSQGQRSDILAGDYMISHSMTGRDILRTLTTNPLKSNEVVVKINNGMTTTEIAKLLETKGVINADVLLAATFKKDSRTVVDKEYSFFTDKPATADLRGYLYPDTYRFFKNSSASTVLQKFFDNFEARVSTTLRDAAKASGHTLFEELIMASILEKELKTDTDRAKGADVFWKRIEIGMALQSNATILYAAGLSEDNLSVADTKFDSPYNTYLHKGLPPGPINNPSIKSLRAAIYPEKNPYYYFLSAPDTGITYFAKTLDEHNEYKAKYLK